LGVSDRGENGVRVGDIFCVSVGMENRGECVGSIRLFRGSGEQGEGGVDIECVSGTGNRVEFGSHIGCVRVRGEHW